MSTVIDRSTITHRHWQPRLSRAEDATGQIVTGLEDIHQCIMTIALTEKGSVPGQPEKCVQIQPYIDRRPDYAIPYLVRELFEGVRIWEPRVIVEAVSITPEDLDHWRMPIYWRLRADTAREIYQTIPVLPVSRRPVSVGGA